ncbi:penicillin-binding protein 1C [Leptospira kobayashii]|uniref:peptidoglycan glycosyltransferase n=1 Tax=Leptospira kobayashii TaxID=1917830 RepID=A0ABM7UI36_9LEPT|nr:transglycosylase domain-containing protein [Leptospira kobayashii]BDA78374.1 penicillin-binding protein 1C [Leptospira kobayashii]
MKFTRKTGKHWFILIAINLCLFVFLLTPVSFEEFKTNSSLRILSLEKASIGNKTNVSGAFRDWVSLDQYPKHVLQTVIFAEDKRFYNHPGFDPIAMLRALYSLVNWNEKTNGGSTITQQLVRIQNPKIRSLPGYVRKPLEILTSVRYTIWLSKKEILEAYLNSISIRSNYEGFSSVSRKYFRKHVRFLSVEEGVAIAVLIRSNSPSLNDFKRRVVLLMNLISPEEKPDLEYLVSSLEIGKQTEVLSDVLKSENQHFKFWIQSELPGLTGSLETHFSNETNHKIHQIVLSELEGLRKYNVSNASVIAFEIPENKKDEIRLVGMIGSKNFFEDGFGQVNGALAYRDAGSTLKPMLYALGVERNLVQINSIMHDENKTFPLEDGSGSYIPRNADLQFWGEMTVAEALANSRNIPAVETARKIGVGEFLSFLRKSGMNHLKEGSDRYGLGLSLGTGGANLFQLARVYASFPLGGILPKVSIGKNGNSEIYFGSSKVLFSKETAEEITHILNDSSLRSRAFGNRNFMDFPYPVSIKTGTSKDFRNSWTIGFTKKYIIGAWVGNFSGEKTMEVSGSFGAGRIFHSVMRYMMERETDRSYLPVSVLPKRICRKTGMLALETCPFVTLHMRELRSPKEYCSRHKEKENLSETKESITISFPANGQVFLYHPGVSKNSQEIPVRLRNYRYKKDRNPSLVLNGSFSIPIPISGNASIPIERGEHSLALKEEGKEIQKIRFIVK